MHTTVHVLLVYMYIHIHVGSATAVLYLVYNRILHLDTHIQYVRVLIIYYMY